MLKIFENNLNRKIVIKVVHDHDVLVENISETRVYRANQDQIRNQRPRLYRNTLFLGRKAWGIF